MAVRFSSVPQLRFFAWRFKKRARVMSYESEEFYIFEGYITHCAMIWPMRKTMQGNKSQGVHNKISQHYQGRPPCTDEINAKGATGRPDFWLIKRAQLQYIWFFNEGQWSILHQKVELQQPSTTIAHIKFRYNFRTFWVTIFDHCRVLPYRKSYAKSGLLANCTHPKMEKPVE